MAAVNPYFFPINQLPDHILLEIFLRIDNSYTSRTRDCVDFPCRTNCTLAPIASVCSRWRRLYFDPQMWRSKFIHLSYLHLLRHPFEFFSVLNRMAGEIHNLEISGCGSFGHRFLPMLPTFPNVEQLIVNVRLPSREVDLLVEKFPAVQSVEIADYQLDDEDLLQMAEGWENLRKFDIWTPHERLTYPTNVTGAGLIRFAQVANHLESLNISRFPIRNLTDRKFDKITKALGVGLKSITFGFKQAKLSGLAIESLVRNCPNLEQICLEKERSVPMVLLPIGRLKDLAQLKCLKLYWPFGNTLHDCQGLEDLFSRPLSQFRSFEAEHVANLTDSHLELIANSCPQLECLSIDVNVYTSRNFGLITDSGLAHIVNNCRNLRVLCLRGFPLLTGRFFIGAGAKLPNLSRLELHNCENVDAEMVRREFVMSTRLQIESDLPGPWDQRRFVLRRVGKRRRLPE